MRPATLSAPVLPGASPAPTHSDWATLKKLGPYVWQWRWRVLVALSCLVAAKFANIGVPLILKQLVDALDLKLSSSLVAPWSRWITPVIPNMPRRRFDTRFFVARMPAGQSAAVADRESTIGCWLGAREALEMYWQRDIELAPPQIITLAHLSRYASAAAALEAARATVPRLIHPVHIEVDAARVFCYPGDAAHGNRESAFPGVSRLVLRDGRFEPFDGFEAFFSDSAAQRL